MSSLSPAAAEQAQRQALTAVLERAELTMEQLWLRYFAIGGGAGPLELEAHLQGLMFLSPLQGDMLAQAVNERLDELAWTSRIPYVRTVREHRPPSGTVAALVALLDGSQRAAPEQLPAVAASAGQALGLQVSIYLVDERQRCLVPLPGPGVAAGEPLAVDTTVAGRAFRAVETLATDLDAPAGTGPEGLQLWVPLMDGAERLGVLDVTLTEDADPLDQAVRDQCRWLSGVLGHLITVAEQDGDALRASRRQPPRTPAAELMASLRPRLTVGTAACVLAGLVEQSSDVAGDAFDYSLSGTTATFALFDVKGRGLDGALTAAAAVAAYRSSRRDGSDLHGQARAIDDAVAACLGGGRYVTGILGELDLASGRLGYLAAGHPYPRLVRRGAVARTLTGGRRLGLGFYGTPAPLGEEGLEPGDCLLLHTDGLTDARNEAGARFGEDRFTDLLAALAGCPPPEVARRLLAAAVAHHGDPLDDDATVLIARWNGPDRAPE